MTNTTNLGITLIAQSQAQKEVTANQAFTTIDALMNVGAIDRGLDTPPGSPLDGDLYIIGSSPTGAWAGQAGNIAYYQSGWKFITPNEGMTLWVNDEDLLYTFDGSAWNSSGGGGGGAGALDDLSDVAITSVANYHILQYDGTNFVNQLNIDNVSKVGINATSDSTNKLSVSSAAVLFNHNGSNSQVKVNKSSGTDTASHLFQNGFSGRAEFGLIGDDNFQVKVSSDGSSWNQSYVITASSGDIEFKQDVTFSGIVSCADNVVSRPELKDYAETLNTNSTSGSTPSIDLQNGNVHDVTLSANATFTFSNPPASGKGGSFTLILRQDGTGGRTVTWPASVDWAGGAAPTLTTAASSVDILTFMTVNGGTTWYGFLAGGDMQ